MDVFANRARRKPYLRAPQHNSSVKNGAEEPCLQPPPSRHPHGIPNPQGSTKTADRAGDETRNGGANAIDRQPTEDRREDGHPWPCQRGAKRHRIESENGEIVSSNGELNCINMLLTLFPAYRIALRGRPNSLRLEGSETLRLPHSIKSNERLPLTSRPHNPRPSRLRKLRNRSVRFVHEREYSTNPKSWDPCHEFVSEKKSAPSVTNAARPSKQGWNEFETRDQQEQRTKAKS